MIFINTIPNDFSTSEVIDWILYFNKSALRANKSDLFSNDFLISLKGDEADYIRIDNRVITLQEITAYWYRKGIFSQNRKINLPNNIQNKSELVTNINEELKDLSAYFHYQLSNKKRNLNKNKQGNINKLIVLNEARKLGISVPSYIITNRKKSLVKFVNKNKEVVIKPISNIAVIETTKGDYIQYTTLLNEEKLKSIPDVFFPCLFQKYINKEYEIRTFYLKGKLYSMAMFTQKNNQTKIDFRKYVETNIERRVPYRLPLVLESKIDKLFKTLDLDTGSIDLIYKDRKYYLLEINPVGQFGMVSYPCNYYLEKKIAESLTL